MATKNLITVFALSALFLTPCDKDNESDLFSGPAAGVSISIANINDGNGASSKSSIQFKAPKAN